MTKEDFSPENIHQFIESDEYQDIISTGSYSLFKDIEGFEPHDYDYALLIKSDENSTAKQNYMWMDCKVIYYKPDMSKQEYIEFILNEAQTYPMLTVGLFTKNQCEFFHIEFSDIEPYLGQIEERVSYAAEHYPKYKYYSELLKYVKENRSFDITEEQLMNVYQLYKENRKMKFFGKGVQCKPIEQNDENKEILDSQIS